MVEDSRLVLWGNPEKVGWDGVVSKETYKWEESLDDLCDAIIETTYITDKVKHRVDLPLIIHVIVIHEDCSPPDFFWICWSEIRLRTAWEVLKKIIFLSKIEKLVLQKCLV